MTDYRFDIKIDKSTNKFGYIKGNIDDFAWYALVHKDEVEHGINPIDLTKGYGRISRLCIFKDQSDFSGNPYAPSMSVRRYIFANYHREWSVLNRNYYDMTKELISYLERRYSLRIIK